MLEQETAAKILNKIAPGIIICCGLIGNGLALCTLISNKSIRKRTSSLLLCALLLVDSVVLCSGCLLQWLACITDGQITNELPALKFTDEENITKEGGRIIQAPRFGVLTLVYSLHYTFYTLSGFLVTLIAIERLLAVSRPLSHYQTPHKYSRLLLMVYFLFLLAALIYLPIVLSVKTDFYWNPRSGNLDLIGLYPRWASTIALFTCAAITIPANLTILYFLRQKKKKLRMLTFQYAKPDADYKMTAILLGISFAFLFFTIPNRILVVAILLLDVHIPDLFLAITWNFCHINFAINSLFYFFVHKESRKGLKHVVESLRSRTNSSSFTLSDRL